MTDDDSKHFALRSCSMYLNSQEGREHCQLIVDFSTILLGLIKLDLLDWTRLGLMICEYVTIM